MTRHPVTLLHVVGDADLGLRPGEPRENALRVLQHSPDDAMFRVRDDEATRVPAAPLASVIDQLRAAGWVIDEVVLLCTEQEPPHPLDTVEIARAYVSAASACLSEFNGSPLRVTESRVRSLSLTHFMSVASRTVRHRDNGNRRFAVSLTSGAKAGFLGAVAGVLDAGRLPVIVEVGGDGTPPTVHDTPPTTLDVRRWLTRRRLWAALRTFADLSQEQRDTFTSLMLYEQLAPLHTLPIPLHLQGLSTQLPDRMYSALLSARSIDDRQWPARIAAYFEEITAQRYRQLTAGDRSSVLTWIDAHPNPDCPGSLTGREGAKVWWYATRDPKFQRWADCPSPLREWLYGTDSTPGVVPLYASTNTLRHGLLRISPERADRISALIDDLGSGSRPTTNDPVSSWVGENLPFGTVMGTGASLTIGMRIIGQRENPDIAGTALNDLATSGRHAMVTLTTGPSGDDSTITIEGFDLHGTIDTCRDALRRVIAQHERDIPRRNVTAMRVYLGQGTKAMNLGLLLAAATVAAEGNISLEIREVARDGDGSVVRGASLATSRLLPARSMLAALRSCLEQLALDAAFVVLTSIDATRLDHTVRALLTDVRSFIRRATATPAKGDLHGAAELAYLYWHHRDAIGSQETMIKASSHLSRALGDEFWTDGDEAVLRSFKQQRGNAFHGRPCDLTGLRFDAVVAALARAGQLAPTGAYKSLTVAHHDLLDRFKHLLGTTEST